MKTRNEVSAGGVVYRESDDGTEIALIRTHEGRWQLPKGWIEPDESMEQAAVREVREEAGIDADLIGAIDDVRYTYRSTYDPEPALVRKVVHFFLLRYADGSTDDHDDEVTEARFVPIEDALTMLAFKDERRIVGLARDAIAGVANEGASA